MSLTTNTAGWRKTGNTGTTPGINFLGTTDAVDFVIKTNNLERLRVASDGSVGINKSDPSELLDIEKDVAGDSIIRLAHTLTGSSNHATVDIQTQGSGGGDPRVHFNVKGVADGDWTIGIDNSDLDVFKISRSNALGTRTRIKIEKDGKVFLNRNVEIGPAALTEVQFQLLSKPSQSANIMQVGEDSGDIDGFFVMDEVGNIGLGASIDPIAKLHVDGSFFVTGNLGFFGATPVAQVPAYTPTNVTTDRSYNADITTVNQLADILGTLITDLQTYGLLQ